MLYYKPYFFCRGVLQSCGSLWSIDKIQELLYFGSEAEANNPPSPLYNWQLEKILLDMGTPCNTMVKERLCVYKDT